METKEPRVVIVVPNYNGATNFYNSRPILWHLLNSLKGTNYKNYKLVLSDDSSPDESIRYVKSKFSGTEMVINRPNGGYTINANKGIKYAIRKYDPVYIVLLNSDIIIKDRSWLKKMVQAAEDEPTSGVIGCKILYPDGRLQSAGTTSVGIITRSRGWNTNDADKYNEIEEVKAVAGAVFMIRKKAIEKIGLLDENFFMGSDDLEYCLRADKAHLKVIYAGNTSAIHLEGYTAKAVSSKKGKDYWFPIFQTNNMYLAFKHLSKVKVIGTIFIILLSSVIGISNRKMSLQSIRFKDRVLWRFYVSLKSIFVGYNLYKGRITRKQAYGL